MESQSKNCYQFKLNEIGPVLANLLTRVEGNVYHYHLVHYHGQDYYVGHYDIETNYLNGMCAVVTNNEQSIIREDGNVGNFCQKEGTICLATLDFRLPPTFYGGKLYWTPKVEDKDAMITLYDSSGEELLFFEKYSYIYDFIDFVISQKVFELQDGLSMEEYNELIDEFVKANVFIRRRGNKYGETN